MKQKVAILLATYNGERFLDEQLQSLACQTVDNIDLWISDDGSDDNTLGILEEFSNTWTKGNIRVLRRQQSTDRTKDTQLKSNSNFRALILNEDIKADYYAFCDQDDIWLPEKLANSIAWLNQQDVSVPALHCSRTTMIDVRNQTIGASLLFNRTPEFRNAIIQNIAAGNTLMINHAGMEIVRLGAAKADFVSHDWWCYLAVTAVGGNVCYSQVRSLLYRQHSGNLIGRNDTVIAKILRLFQLLGGRFKQWNAQNREILETIVPLMTNEAKQTLNDLDEIRAKGGIVSTAKLVRSGIRRQSFSDQLFLYFAAFLGRI